MLQSMGSQRVRHDLVIEEQQQQNYYLFKYCFHPIFISFFPEIQL